MKQLVLPAGSRSNETVVLKGKEHHYLSRVRRVTIGDKIDAIDDGFPLSLEVVEITADRIRFHVLGPRVVQEQARCRVVLFPCLLKARKLDDVVRQAVEAGVSEIVPVLSDHSIVRLDDPQDANRKAARWAAIAVEATQQSGSQAGCQVRPPIGSHEVSSYWKAAGPLLFFHQSPLDNRSLHSYLFPRPASVGLVIGPEGGLSAQEVTRFQDQGALPVWLGPFVLRAETASLYAVASVNTILQESSEWIIPH